uniref:Acyl carrier protein n=1 Tax=Chromulina nebulosa TaxID=96789 RepID=A0A7S0SXJ4_9STRA|mmetsp:Transcript_4749/g.4250  ORF Transcript_4749/g.4250 Transcript_4749/m.4250 type:complete len:146 (+) Transcript_4749:34-471(+)
MSRLIRTIRKFDNIILGLNKNIVVNNSLGYLNKQQLNLFLLTNRSFATDHHHDDHGHATDEPFLDPKFVTERIIEVVKNFEKVTASKVTPQARFKEDLDLDSLDAVEVVMAIEEEFNIEIPDSEADKILSIADAISYISAHPAAK